MCERPEMEDRAENQKPKPTLFPKPFFCKPQLYMKPYMLEVKVRNQRIEYYETGICVLEYLEYFEMPSIDRAIDSKESLPLVLIQ